MPSNKVVEFLLVDGVKVLEFMESAELDYVQTIGCDHICTTRMNASVTMLTTIIIMSNRTAHAVQAT